jgi:hypothetical protein
MSSDIKHNAEGYKDSTAYKAIVSMEDFKKRQLKEQAEHDELIKHIRYIVNLAGFKLTDRVKLMHKESRRRYE